jgi:hypothetical protein
MLFLPVDAGVTTQCNRRSHRVTDGVAVYGARQRIVTVVPHGDANDPTGKSEYYSLTCEYLESTRFRTIWEPPATAP